MYLIYVLVQDVEAVQPSAIASSPTKPGSLDYHRECENYQMAGKIHEALFPRSYLIESVEEWLPHNGKVKGLFSGGLCDKTISSDSITQRMLLITAKIETFEFSFGKNPWAADMKFNLGFPQLLSFRLNELEVVSNCGEEGENFDKLSVALDADHPYFDSIRVQCVLSLQNNPSNVKHICFLEVTAKYSTASLGGDPLSSEVGKWSIGKELEPTKDATTLGGVEVYVFAVEEVVGPLVFTGVGIDNYAGFVFQIARVDDTSDIASSIEECFYEEDPRLTSADITHYNYFESNGKAQTGYRENGQFSTHIVRNLFREMALEDKQVAILLQKLNHFYPEFTTNPVSKVLPIMLDILERCFADNQISLIQSVIRVSHIKSDDSMINPPVRQIFSTFTKTISIVKQFVLKRPNLNMIECAILSDNKWGKVSAILVAISQFLIAGVLAWHVFFAQADDSADSAKCDVFSIFTDVMAQSSVPDMRGCIMKCYWKVDFSFMMTIIAVVVSCIKVGKQIQDQRRFHAIFKPLMKVKPSAINIVLLLLDCCVNVVLSCLTVVLTLFLISLADEVTDLVLNCLAITFIVELDEDLNDRDPVEVEDLVIQSFKKYLIADMMRESGDISHQHSGNEEKKSEKASIFELFVGKILNSLLFENTPNAACPKLSNGKINTEIRCLGARLVNADYSSNEKSTKVNSGVTDIVKSQIEKGVLLLPVLNDRFQGDPHPGKPKFLVLQFRGDTGDIITFSVREKLVVDFKVVESMLRNTKNGSSTTNSDQQCVIIKTSLLDRLLRWPFSVRALLLFYHIQTNKHTYIHTSEKQLYIFFPIR